MQTLTIGIIGLGLIGGSLARAVKAHTPHTVAGYDLDEDTMHKALADGAIDGVLDESALARCDVLFAALYPAASIDAVITRLPLLKAGCVVADLCGIKRAVCDALDAPCRDAGVVFVGAHPMAGREFSGFDHSIPTLFAGAPLLLTPTDPADPGQARAAALLETLARDLGFRETIVTTPDHHDRMIAYTSQLAHVLSNAYVKSPCAPAHDGYSAGSFKDLTRVARLNEAMWTQLFLQNSDHLTDELSLLIDNLTAYKTAIEAGDADTLQSLLREGRKIKEGL
ncbi:MAG: prephenate dehydrogenase [Acetanaerobacterium sp.]